MMTERITVHSDPGKMFEDFSVLSHQILALAIRGARRFEFLRSVTEIILDYSGCDAVELRTQERNRWFICQTKHEEKIETAIDTFTLKSGRDLHEILQLDIPDLEKFYRLLVNRYLDPSLLTKQGTFWTGDASVSLRMSPNRANEPDPIHFHLGSIYPSLMVIPFNINDENKGLLILKSKQRDYFTTDDVGYYESLSLTLGAAVLDRRAQVALRERVKELTCLYGIARLVEQPEISIDAFMQGIVELLPPAWLYPEISIGRIVLDDRVYTTKSDHDGYSKLSAPVVVAGVTRGTVEVIYSEERPDLDEGPFLKEERSLINAIAWEVALFIEQRQAKEERSKLHEQLRHADRLATIGQLAAGVAHELNEPLGNILGFGQLAQKSPGISEQISKDIDKIINASLHAREIIKKLMVFARQTPPKKTQVDLNRVIAEGLSFFEARCAKADIELIKELDPQLPKITADLSQLNQVLVNLVVNSIQAMPNGGRLIVRTIAKENNVLIQVEDTGIGMSKDIIKQIFVPFFTTKDIDEGTGLGLAVVHGIVTSHKGTITVDSEVGGGTSFVIQLPLTEAAGG